MRKSFKTSSETFPDDILRELYSAKHPAHWLEMPAHQLIYGRGWTCIAMLGFIDGDLNRPAMELEVQPELLQRRAKRYLAPLLESQAA